MRINEKSLNIQSRIIRRPWPGARYLTVVEVTRPSVAPWLVFFTNAKDSMRPERRRLRPAPAAWAKLKDEELIALYRRADRISRPHSGLELREIEGHCGAPLASDLQFDGNLAVSDEDLLTVLQEQEVARKELSEVRAELELLSLLMKRGDTPLN